MSIAKISWPGGTRSKRDLMRSILTACSAFVRTCATSPYSGCGEWGVAGSEIIRCDNLLCEP